jgi:hypothetical protein
MDDAKEAENWAETMEAVAVATPLVKQFTFLASAGRLVPLWLMQYVQPMGRLLALQAVCFSLPCLGSGLLMIGV